MFNPLADDFSTLSDDDLNKKISELSRRYSQTSNPSLQNQIVVMLDMFRQEYSDRLAKKSQEFKDNDNDSGLDNLINID